ncbi:GMC oxidoreductase [Earliella scabrosa]|nr:GMC oxidoreductase [Earliella scabrosa]
MAYNAPEASYPFMTTPEVFCAQTFDYVIIGGGTTGLVVAARLTEDPAISVGVIEAGAWHPDEDGINIPGKMGMAIGNPELDWSFTSVPQKHANNRSVFQPRGKGLGGSSLLNFFGLTRASSHEYDAIEALGNPGWNWEEFLKYFKKSETTQPVPSSFGPEYKLSELDPQWHGDSGPLLKGYPLHLAALHIPFLNTLENLGVPRNFEPGNGNAIGAATILGSIDARTATRSYSANAYYAPNAVRKNLYVLTKSHVSRILFRPGDSPLTATGVEFINGETRYTVKARREVILCAGAFQTPQILELSGIGNKEILSKYGVETLVDLPSDHIFVPVINEIDPSSETIDADLLTNPDFAAKQAELYKSRKGYLTSGFSSLFAFVPLRVWTTEEQRDRWKTMAHQSIEEAPQGLKKQLEMQLQWLSDPSSAEGEVIPFPGFFPGAGPQPVPNRRYSSVFCSATHPFSRGSVHIASSDPKSPPAIDPNYLSNPLDVEIMLALVKFGLKVYETSPIREAIVRNFVPQAAADGTELSDDVLVEYIKNTCSCVFHPLGSASMLPREDGGVVDPELRVYGTANVRVVDASILPMQIAAHIQATVYAVAEKGADIIKYGQKRA